MRYFTAKLSDHMERTPEGYLLCRAVPVARTGTLEYLPEEVPEELSQGWDGNTVQVLRQDCDVFSAATMASFEGKPVTVDHPDDFVTPENWRDLACGHAQNVRRGEGKEADLLLADLLITDEEAIALIMPETAEAEALREVSCGYDAEYETVKPGTGRQVGIVGNHIALVPAGRCGGRCAIKDAAPVLAKNSQKKEPVMAVKKKSSSSWLDRIFKNPAVRKAMDEAAATTAADEEAQKAADEAAPGQDTGQDTRQAAADSPEALVEKLDEILVLLRSLAGRAADEAAAQNAKETGEAKDAEDDDPELEEGAQTSTDDDPVEDEDPNPEENFKARDAMPRSPGGAKLAGRAVFKDAAILAPELRFAPGNASSMVKRASLRSAMRDAAMSKVVTACLGSATLDTAPRHVLDAAFAAAVQVRRVQNNHRTGGALAGAKGKDAAVNRPVSPADINKMNREHRDSLNKRN